MKNTTLTKMPKNFHRIARDPKIARKGRVEVQSYAVDANNTLICAGVHHVPALNAKLAWRIFTNYRRWRKWQDNLPWNRPHDYPAKHSKPVAFFGIHPMDNPKQMLWLKVG